MARPKTGKTAHLFIRLAPEDRAEVLRAADREGRTMGDFARRALLFMARNLEQVNEYLAELEAARNGKGK